MNPIFRNTLISGAMMMLAFLLLFLLRPEEGSRNIDNISSPGTTMLFVLGMILPGFLFGLAMVLATPSVSAVKKIAFFLLSGFLYIGLVIGAIGKGSASTLPIVIASGIGGVVIILLVHFLLYSIPLPKSVLIGLVIGILSSLPFFWMFQSPEEAKSIGRIAGVIGLSIYFFWQAGMGYYLSTVIRMN